MRKLRGRQNFQRWRFVLRRMRPREH
ncbi:hypothetical protein ScalyP_jg1170, partial [Parmales sp. scaly parma]